MGFARFVDNIKVKFSKNDLLSLEFEFDVDVFKEPFEGSMVSNKLKFLDEEVGFALLHIPDSSKAFSFYSTIMSFCLAEGLVEEFDNAFFSILVSLSKNSTNSIIRGISIENKWFAIVRSN